MVWLIIALGAVALITVMVAVARYAVRLDRALVARAEIRAQQRIADAEMQRVVQQTVQAMFHAARRPQ